MTAEQWEKLAQDAAAVGGAEGVSRVFANYAATLEAERDALKRRLDELESALEVFGAALQKSPDEVIVLAKVLEEAPSW